MNVHRGERRGSKTQQRPRPASRPSWGRSATDRGWPGLTIGPAAFRGGLLLLLLVGVAGLASVSQWLAGQAWPAQSTRVPSAPSVRMTRLPVPQEAVFSVATTQPLFALTVNVDWGNEQLGPLLEVLRRFDARVTFFPTGRWAAQNRQWIRRFVEEGHEVGNHGMSHRHPKQLSAPELKALIEDNARLLSELTDGRVVNLFAPPYGEFDNRIVRVAREAGHITVMWTIDTVDWKRPAPDAIVRRVVDAMRPGAIVLMHPVEQTVQALPTILTRLGEQGYRPVPLGQLLQLAR